MKKFLMFVVAILALAVAVTGCATNRDTAETADEASSEMESESEEKDLDEPSPNFFASEDWTDLDKQEELVEKVISTRQEGALQYEPHGIYELYGKGLLTYIFDSPNDFYQVVMMGNNESFPFIIHNTGNHGVSFQSIFYEKGKFIGLTANYVLFEEDDGTVKAVSIKEKEDCEIGEYQFDVLDFSSLSQEEQDSAIYPSGMYLVTFLEPFET